MASPSSTLSLISCALVTGGASGIGRALATYLISQGKTVLIAGRTESTLRTTSTEIGAKDYFVLDTGDTNAIADVVPRILERYPQLNCLINNAGVQRPFELPGSNFTKGEYSFDLEQADSEININIRGPMHLTAHLLPHFTQLAGPSVLINVSSVLGFLPSSIINPVYNGTKSFIHFFTTNARTQLRNTRVRVVEIVPPTVATNLHRDRTDPDDNKKDKNSKALSLEEFMKEVSEGLEKEGGVDTISAGTGKDLVKTWEETMGARYEKIASGSK